MIATIAEARTYLGLAASTIGDTDLGLINDCLLAAHASVRKHLRYDPEQQTRTEFYPRGVERSASGGEGTWDSRGGQAFFEPASGGGEADVLVLAHIPVRSITSLYEDSDARFGTAASAFPASTLLTQGTDYWPEFDSASFCMSGIIRRNTAWPTSPGSVKVTYVAGWSADELAGVTVSGGLGVPDARDIKEAVLLAACRKFKERKLHAKSSRAGWIAGPLTGETLGSYSYTADGSSAEQFNLTIDLSKQERDMLESHRHYGALLT